MTAPIHPGEGESMPHHTGIQRIHGYCGLCRAACGTVATVDHGRFIRLDPDPSHPTGQALCAKGRAAPELVYHPERLTHPLRRTRPKGEVDPGWERMNWDTALGHPRGFATPSRRIELYAETFLEHGYAPLPEFVEPAIGPVARPDLAARFPLVLTCAKPGLFCQSQHRALPSLRKRVLDPTVALHPEAARTRQIAQGDWVSIETPSGSIRARAHLNADLDPRVVVGEHGWWQGCAALGASAYDPLSQEGANFNLLIGSDTLDPVSGTASHRAYLCEIRPVAEAKGAGPSVP
jgi:anaerobic selenocysteine-containing dehydrogenase